MGKHSKNIAGTSGLFALQATAHARRVRRQRALFIPRYVREAAASEQLAGPERDRAYAIAEHWADLEANGHLGAAKETSIDTQFLGQLFGEGLGYRLKTESPGDYHLDHKHAVPGVGTADAALGEFPANPTPRVVVELKGSGTDLDRDRSNGRTAVQQCWDYMNAVPGCEWGIVSNFSTIRLYHKTKGSQAYEEYTLRELRDPARFAEFYAVFERGGLLTSALKQPPRAAALLQRTEKRQKEVGDELYESYRLQRLHLIDHLMKIEDKSLDRAIATAQKLLDRIIFIAFCEDRELLPEKCLERAHGTLPAFSRVKNPRWHNFLGLFGMVDKGNEGTPPIDRFNGGLFADDPEIDNLELDDEPWTGGFRSIGTYDFSEEVNVEVLGQLFERSITELEKLRVGGLFALKANIEGNGGNGGGASKGKKKAAKSSKAGADDGKSSGMPKSAQRKRFGIYYTPPAFTGLLVDRTVDAVVRDRFAALAQQHGVDPDSREPQDASKLRAYWSACLGSLKTVTVCDPACGSGAFLIRAYDALDAHYKAVVHGLAGAGEDAERIAELEDSVPDLILSHNIFGVDLSKEGVEITQLALWIRSARKGKTLADLSKNIIHGNSLVSDPEVAGTDFEGRSLAVNWADAFPHVFAVASTGASASGAAKPAGRAGPKPMARGGFTCVIGNPPWERVKVQDREFFSLTDPDTAEAVSAADRKKRIAAMPKANPDLHASYLAAKDSAQKVLDYARGSGRYPLTGKGDVNLYMLFAELAQSLVAPDGMAGLLVPSGIATDDTTKDFFTGLMDDKRLVSLYDFENRDKVFEDVDGRFKFSALVFGGRERVNERADFVFFARDVEETSEVYKQRHIPLTAADMKLLNPNTRTCPIFRTRRDADLTKAIYKRVPILIDQNRRKGGNPWGIKFLRMFDQTNDAEHFAEGKVWEKKGYRLDGNFYVKNKKRALPLYEAKMVQAFDHRAASVVVDDENWVRQGQKAETTPVEHANPEFAVMPRWWVAEDAVAAVANGSKRDWLLVYKDITSATNERTMIAAFTPWAAVVNSAPIKFTAEGIEPRREACLLGNLNAFVYDFVARQKVGGVHLNFFIVEQLPTLPPDTYEGKCPWSKKETLEHWISERVLKLTCTAEDMIPLANACQFKGNWPPAEKGTDRSEPRSVARVHKWKEQERAELRAQLDAAYFILYGVNRPDAEYILSTFTGTGYVPPKDRGPDGGAWTRGGQGDMILEAYDHLSGLTSA